MDDQNTPERRDIPENQPDFGDRSEYSRTTWRACCMAPSIAIGVLLILTLGVGLLSTRGTRQPANRTNTRASASPEVRQAFIGFGKQYFAIADRADNQNEAAFKVLRSYAGGNNSIEEVHSAFRTATDGNRRASQEFKALRVPQQCTSREKMQRSLDTISRAYDARRRACETIVGWNGDANDQATADRYRKQAEEVNTLTREGLTYLGEAASENGLTADDVKKFLPSAMGEFHTDPMPEEMPTHR